MFKPTALKLIIGLVLVAGSVFVALNAHIDIFPCVQKEMNFQTNTLETRDTSCSLLAVYNQEHRDGESAALTPAGFAVAGLVLGLVPLMIGFMIGGRLGKRS